MAEKRLNMQISTDIQTGDYVLIRIDYGDEIHSPLAHYRANTATWEDEEIGLTMWIEGRVKSSGLIDGEPAIELEVIDPWDYHDETEVIEAGTIGHVFNFSR